MAQPGSPSTNGFAPDETEAFAGVRPSARDLLGFTSYMLGVGGGQPDFATLFTTLGRALSGQPLEGAWLPVETPPAERVAPSSGGQLDCDAPPEVAAVEVDWSLAAVAARAAAASF